MMILYCVPPAIDVLASAIASAMLDSPIATALRCVMGPERGMFDLERHGGSEDEQAPVAGRVGVLGHDEIRRAVHDVRLELPQPVIVDVEPHGRRQVVLVGIELLAVLGGVT